MVEENPDYLTDSGPHTLHPTPYTLRVALYLLFVGGLNRTTAIAPGS